MHDKASFGEEGGEYDWGARDVRGEQQRYSDNKRAVEDLSKRVNRKVDPTARSVHNCGVCCEEVGAERFEKLDVLTCRLRYRAAWVVSPTHIVEHYMPC